MKVSCTTLKGRRRAETRTRDGDGGRRGGSRDRAENGLEEELKGEERRVWEGLAKEFKGEVDPEITSGRGAESSRKRQKTDA